MKVYQAAANAVVAEGCDVAFGLVGDANMSFWSALNSTGAVRMYSARHEAGAVAMADGYARASGEVGLASITSGPGLTQIGTSLTAAARNRTPLLVVVGDVAASDLNNVQKFDQRRFASACESEFVPITDTGNVAREMAEAFYAARLRKCPVVVNLPSDVQEQSFDWEFSYTPTKGFLPVPEDAPRSEVVEDLVERLLVAERPVIVAGLGAKLAGAREAIVELADRVGALLATSLKGKGLFTGHAFDVGLAGSFSSAPTERLLAEADFVLGIGAELGYYTTEGGLLFPDAAIARIDSAVAPPELGVLPGLYVRGDAKQTVLALNRSLARRGIKKAGFRTAQTIELLSAPVPALFDTPPDGIDPRNLAREIGVALPANAVVTVGVGHFFSFFIMYSAVPHTADVHFSYQFGSIGQTIPIAAGIGATRPGRPHLVIDGDGSAMMNIQELETMARHGIPAVVLIWNDGGLGAEVHKMKAKGFDSSLARWPNSPDFVGVTRAFGGDGLKLTDVSGLRAALAKGFGCGGLFVIDARVSPTVVSDPYLKLHFGKENKAPLLRPAESRA